MASVSDDWSCRIYTLAEIAVNPVEQYDNPSWPQNTNQDTMANAGPAFGLRYIEPEGFGYGRCIAVLVGGPYTGHIAPITYAVNKGCFRFLTRTQLF